MSGEDRESDELVEWSATVFPFLVVGETFFGVCDRVPGVSHRASLFIHIFEVPLVPRRSAIFCYAQEMSYVVETSLNFKSVVMAYARTLLFASMLLSAYLIVMGALPVLQGEFRSMAIGVCMLVIAACSFKVLIYFEKASQANAERTCAYLSEVLQTPITTPDATELKACDVCGRESMNTLQVCPFCQMALDALQS